MARSNPPPETPLLYLQFSDAFEAVKWGNTLSGPFDVTNLLQTLMVEAQARQMGVCVQAAVVPLDFVFGPEGTPQDENSIDERIHEDDF